MRHMTMKRRTLRLRDLLVAAGAALAVGACSEHQDLTGPPPVEVVEIEIRNFQFSPSELTIAPGTTVRWRNTTATFHTVTPDGHAQWSEWQTAGMGQTFDVRFDQAGEFRYFCSPHRSLGMTGTIIVQ